MAFPMQNLTDTDYCELWSTTDLETPELVVENLANEMKAYSEQGKPVHISLSGGSTPKMLFQNCWYGAPRRRHSVEQPSLLVGWWALCCAGWCRKQLRRSERITFLKCESSAENIHRIRGGKYYRKATFAASPAWPRWTFLKTARLFLIDSVRCWRRWPHSITVPGCY